MSALIHSILLAAESLNPDDCAAVVNKLIEMNILVPMGDENFDINTQALDALVLSSVQREFLNQFLAGVLSVNKLHS